MRGREEEWDQAKKRVIFIDMVNMITRVKSVLWRNGIFYIGKAGLESLESQMKVRLDRVGKGVTGVSEQIRAIKKVTV